MSALPPPTRAPRLVATDLDGTLLRPDGTVSPRTAAALVRAEGAGVEVVFVTTDPERDTGKVLRNYLDRFDPAFIGLTGPIDSIIDVGKGMAVAVEQGHQLPSGGYDVTHGTSVLAIDGGDEVPILWTQGTSATQFASDVHQLLEG